MKNQKNKGVPQLEDGFTRISNELLEAILKRGPKLLTELGRVFFAILRQTYGYNEKSKYIRSSEIQKLTGLKAPNVTRSINALRNSNIITRDNKYGKTGVNKRYREWELSRVIKNKVITRDNSNLSPVITSLITVDNATIYKDNLKKILKKEGEKTPPSRSLLSIKKCFESFGVTGEEKDLQATLFFNHHESINWMKGKTPIVDYRPLIENWIVRDRKKAKNQKSLNIGVPDRTFGLAEIETEAPLTEQEAIQEEIDKIESGDYFKWLTEKAGGAATKEELEKIFDIPTTGKLLGFRQKIKKLRKELQEAKNEQH